MGLNQNRRERSRGLGNGARPTSCLLLGFPHTQSGVDSTSVAHSFCRKRGVVLRRFHPKPKVNSQVCGLMRVKTNKRVENGVRSLTPKLKDNFRDGWIGRGTGGGGGAHKS